MKRLVLVLLLLCPMVVYAQDRVSVKVEFKKALWTCPVCKQEDVEDMKVAGGNEYTHTCSKCGMKFNQSGANMKEYNGCLSYPYTDYPGIKQEDITAEKVLRFDKWVYEIKNPPVYVEPTLEDLQNMYKDKVDEATKYLEEIAKKTTKIELEENKTEGKEKLDKVTK